MPKNAKNHKKIKKIDIFLFCIAEICTKMGKVCYNKDMYHR